MDAEFVHIFFLKVGKLLASNILTKSLTSLLFNYQNPSLQQRILNLNFPNPVGLAAGFDKNAEIFPLMSDIGFGFAELGSITALPCKGNPGKRLKRLITQNSIWVNLGLNNKGAKETAKYLNRLNYSSNIPIGISIAKTNCALTASLDSGIKDYLDSLKILAHHADYLTINVSCPNAFGGQPFHTPDTFKMLISEISKLNITKPIFVKLSPDIPSLHLDKLIETSIRYKISGIICSNLTKETGKSGGYSGKILEQKSNQMLAHIYKKAKGKLVLIGVGGIFTAQDAYKKIRLGANLVQLVTGMIYQGPQVISEINQGLAQFLKRDGFHNVREAVGVDSR